MYESAFDASCKIAKEKGPFPYVKDSIWAGKSKKPRNVALLTFPPSLTIFLISSKLEFISEFFGFSFYIGQRGAVLRTPINNAVTPVH